jgi:L-amino acid N-acyltransferase YncA
MTAIQESIVIRPAIAADACALADIYNHYIDETIITFEEQPVSPSDIAERITEVAAAPLPWLVYQHEDRIVGYAYASKWKGRCAYRFSVETTVYLALSSIGKGIGTELYQALLTQLKTLGLHVAIGGIALPNAASVALHEKFGFSKVAHFPEVGFKFGRWIDVGYWQLTL